MFLLSYCTWPWGTVSPWWLILQLCILCVNNFITLLTRTVTFHTSLSSSGWEAPWNWLSLSLPMLLCSWLTLPRPDSNHPFFHIKPWACQTHGTGSIFIRNVFVSWLKLFSSFWRWQEIESEMKGHSYWSLRKTVIPAKQVSFRMYCAFRIPKNTSLFYASISLHAYLVLFML